MVAVKFRMEFLVLVLIGAAGLCGCSADPYKGASPAPPDRLSPPPASTASAGASTEKGTTGSVPSGDGSEASAPNASGEVPHLAAKQ